MRLKIYHMALILLMSSCLTPIDPESQVFEDMLVVQAVLTDEMKHHQVNLSRTFPIDQDTLRPESNAVVIVERSDGRNYSFEEVRPGVYESTGAFSGVPGLNYSLVIETSSGGRFRSDPVTLQSNTGIEDLRMQFTPEGDVGEGLFELFLDTEPSEEVRYLRWEFTETYRISVENYSQIEWTGQNFIPRQEDLRFCFRNDSSSGVNVQEVNAQSGQVLNYPIHQFESTTQKLPYRYSIEVTQYALENPAFQFWNLIRTNSEDQGGLFDTQPGPIEGNIFSTNRRPVVGIFEATEVTKLRVFWSSSEFEAEGYQPRSRDILNCFFTEPIVFTSPSPVRQFLEENGDRWIPWYVSSGMGTPPGIYFTPVECGDCRVHGYQEVPDFWIE